MITQIVLLLTIGTILTFSGVAGLTSAYAQEEEPSTVQVTLSIVSTIVGFIIVLIPVIRRELIARNVQNPAIVQLLDRVEGLSNQYTEVEGKILQMGEIAYEGISKTPAGKEFIDNIEDKQKVKLVKLNQDFADSLVQTKKFLDVYNTVRPEVKQEPALKTKKVVTTKKIVDTQ